MLHIPGNRRLAHRRDDADVPRITSARSSLAEDIAARNKRYMLQMSTRVVCFLGAVVLDHWTRWLLVVGAVLLPYVAVVLANAGRERSIDPGTYVDHHGLPSAEGFRGTTGPVQHGVHVAHHETARP